MYSIVLATMVTAGSATPSFNGFYSCHGCYGCTGNAFSSCYGCYGSCYGCYGNCYGCYGQCHGCSGCFGSCYGCYGSQAVIVPAKPAPRPPMRMAEAGAAPARVTIVIPEGARLFVNDVPVEVNPAARTFETPALPPGQPYHYVFKAEVQREGRMIRDEQRVEVAAGKQVTVEFKGLPAVAAARR